MWESNIPTTPTTFLGANVTDKAYGTTRVSIGPVTSPGEVTEQFLWAQGNEEGANESIFLGYLKAKIKQA